MTPTDYEKITRHIYPAWKIIRAHPKKKTRGVDGVSIETFAQDAHRRTRALRKRIEEKTFHFEKMKAVDIGSREILVCTVEDRIITRAILDVISPYFRHRNSNHDFSRPVSYVQRDGLKSELQGVPLAAKVIQDNIADGYIWIFETDIRKFFDNLPKDAVLKILSDKITDQDTRALLEEIVRFQVEKEGRDIEVDDKYALAKGVAQGSAISPLLAGIYLYDFDRIFADDPDARLVRYVDDLIIQCPTEEAAHAAYIQVQAELRKLGLEIHEINVPNEKGKIKTRIVKATQESFDFLGLSFNGTSIDISQSKKNQLMADIDEICAESGIAWPQAVAMIERKLWGFGRQYSYQHYTKAKASLETLVKRSQARIERFFTTRYEKITGSDPFRKLSEQQNKALQRFFGLDLETRLMKLIEELMKL